MGKIVKNIPSDDGANWLTCGQVSFPVEDPIMVGIHAIGTTGLRGGYKAVETATRFDYFRVLKMSDQIRDKKINRELRE